MSIAFTIKEGPNNAWCISRGDAILLTGLHLATAIKQAVGWGRDDHAATGLPVCVEMTGPGFAITLAQYAKPQRRA